MPSFDSAASEFVASMSDSKSCSGVIDFMTMRLNSVSCSALVVGLVGDAAEVVRVALRHPADELLHVVVVVLELRGQFVQQFGIGRLVLSLKSSIGLTNPLPKNSPHMRLTTALGKLS